ncbi:hypothetical protein DAETH_18710 [Deinococcus aetherius]|uniref:Uncharacterized protein n=1 Tax=Deinococcus aetherius TaxID=200252 RepID=A0ABN6RJZ6_9DEIO|nr:hypothetical protein DAETH_18710 [Deinococcus aetherius]
MPTVIRAAMRQRATASFQFSFQYIADLRVGGLTAVIGQTGPGKCDPNPALATSERRCHLRGSPQA